MAGADLLHCAKDRKSFYKFTLMVTTTRKEKENVCAAIAWKRLCSIVACSTRMRIKMFLSVNSVSVHSYWPAFNGGAEFLERNP